MTITTRASTTKRRTSLLVGVSDWNLKILEETALLYSCSRKYKLEGGTTTGPEWMRRTAAGGQ
jgi:hypothetical protein